MRKRMLSIGLVFLLMVAVGLAVVACGEEEPATTSAPTESTAPPSSQSTAPASTETTAPASTETTTGGPATGEPIKVGLITSLTGPSAAPGMSVQQGAKLEVEYVNSNGGINGRPLELVVKDDGSDVTGMVTSLTQLIEEDKIDYFVGPFIQYGQEAARDMCEQAQIPMVGAGPVTLAQLKGKQYTWSVMVSAGPPVHSDAYAKLIKAEGYKNILAIGDILTIHQDTLDLLVQKGATEGFTLTKMPDTFGLDQTDFQPILNRVLEEYKKVNPDAFLLSVNPIAAPAMYKGLVALGVKVPIIGSPACAHPAIFSMGPEAVEGFYVVDSGGLINPAGLPDDWPVKEMQLNFYDRYQAMYGSAPDFFAALGTDFILVLEAALKQSGAPEDKEKVRQALLNLKEVPTMEGVVTFSPDNTHEGIRGNMVEWQVKGAQFNLVRVLN